MNKILNEIKKIQSILGIENQVLLSEDKSTTETRLKIIKSLLSK